MPQYKLIYFPFRGLAESIRYLFAYGKTPYENVSVDFETEWPKVKEETPFGQMPILEIDGQKLAQSRAIARYLAREFGIEGKTNLEKAKADMLVEGLTDCISSGVGMLPIAMAKLDHDDAKLNELWSAYKATVIVPFMKQYTSFLTENKSGWFVGDSVTWADFVIAEFLDRMQVSYDSCIFNEFPELEQHRDRVHALDGIAMHVKERPNMPF